MIRGGRARENAQILDVRVACFVLFDAVSIYRNLDISKTDRAIFQARGDLVEII
jgi:hypothetical protein